MAQHEMVQSVTPFQALHYAEITRHPEGGPGDCCCQGEGSSQSVCEDPCAHRLDPTVVAPARRHRTFEPHRNPDRPASTIPGIALEFDDDDALFKADEDLPPREDQLDHKAMEGLRALKEDNSSRSAESGSGSVPSTVPDALALATPAMGEWMGDGSEVGEDEEYSRAREEDSRFDDLVVGFMDEEDEDRRVALEAATPVSKKHRKKP